MKESLLGILADPDCRAPLHLREVTESSADEIISGVIETESGVTYPISNGIPRFVTSEEVEHRQVSQSFGFKWLQRDSYGSSRFKHWYDDWLMKKYGFRCASDVQVFAQRHKRVLEVGCGTGMSSSLSLSVGEHGREWVGVDISSAIDIARERLGHVENASFVQADVLALPFKDEAFDLIIAEGVLHHTRSTQEALRCLMPMLMPGGEVMFYVYSKKAPVREYADDHVRRILAALPPEEAWASLRPLTRLAERLAALNASVDVPDDIPYLGIKAGKYDVQRLIYWHFLKLYWNDEFSFEENNHVNFDWYHPRFAHRQTEADVRRWCEECRLSVQWFDVQESGFTVRAVKS
jgi:arsenite methyltransferase